MGRKRSKPQRVELMLGKRYMTEGGATVVVTNISDIDPLRYAVATILDINRVKSIGSAVYDREGTVRQVNAIHAYTDCSRDFALSENWYLLKIVQETISYKKALKILEEV